MDLQNKNWKKNVGLFLSGQAISLFGSMLVQYAIAWYLTLKTQSGSIMTLAILAGILPTFFVSPLGGVLADRYNRKYLINIADAAIACATLVLAVLFILGYESILLLFVVSAIRAVGAGIQMPAVNALIPQITPPEKLTRINGINVSIQSLTLLAAPMLSGVLLSFASITSIFFIDVITAVIGISIVFFCVHVSSPAGAGRRGESLSYIHDLKEGFIYIRNHGFIKPFCLLSACFYIAAAPMAFLSALQVARNFGADVWRLTVIEISFSFGMLLGGLLMSSWGGFKNRVFSMALSCALSGIGGISLGIAADFPLYTVAMGFIGLVLPLFNVPSMTLLQLSVEESFTGRVFGVFTMISTLMMPMGMLLFGPLSDLVSIDILQIICGAAIFLLSFIFITNKTLRKAGMAAI
jgi:DHA3 family macrolide efflux protein-like MFS transporter